MSITDVVFWILAGASIAGAVGVVFMKDVTRMALSLGLFLLSVAGWFLYFAQAFLAVAQVFVYVGGVLVLVIFAIMVLRRSSEGGSGLESRHSLDALMVSVGVFAIVGMTFVDVAPSLAAVPTALDVRAIGEKLLGDMLPHFEMLAVLLLAALVSVIAIWGGDRS